jgi:protein ImuB
VQVHEGRPVKIITDRRGVAGGPIVQAAGPWRTSGDWWNDTAAPPPSLAQRSVASFGTTHWDRDEWDVALADGTVYRIYVERDVGQWFLEGVVD